MKPEFSSIDWIDYLKFVYSNSVRIILITFIVALSTAGISLLLDNQYKATANLLPNDKRTLSLGLLQGDGAGGIGSIASNVLGGGQSQVINRFYILLESNTTREKVVKEFNLVKHYNTQNAKFPIKAAKQILDERSTFQAREEGNFIIEVWDKNPEIAKQIADFYVERLNELNNEISTREATEY